MPEVINIEREGMFDSILEVLVQEQLLFSVLACGKSAFVGWGKEW